MAREASGFISDKDSVIITSGATPHLTELDANERKNLKIVTDSFFVAADLCHRKDYQTIVLGGDRLGGQMAGIATLENYPGWRGSGMELAEFMKEINCNKAYNLDGGGSSTFLVKDATANKGFKTRNRPTDNTGDRKLPNGLAVVRKK